MKICWLLIVIMAVSFSFPGCTQTTVDSYTTIMKKGEIVVGVKGDTPPFGYKDAQGGLRGFDVDLAKIIAVKLGVTPKFVPLTTAEKFPALLDGRVDLIAACTTITRERERKVDFSMPYFETAQGLLVRADSDISDYMALAGKKVGANKGSTGMAMLKIVAPDAVLVPFTSYNESIAALEKGEIEAMATDHIILVGLLANNEGKFKIATTFGWEPYGLAVRPGDAVLRDRVNEALQDLWDEGAYQQLYDAWFGGDSKYPTGDVFTITTFPRGNLKK